MNKKLSLFLILMISSNLLQAKENIIFGFPPIYEQNVIETGFKPLMEYLSKKLEQPVELYIAKDNKELAALVHENKVQIALFGGTAYVEAQR